MEIVKYSQSSVESSNGIYNIFNEGDTYWSGRFSNDDQKIIRMMDANEFPTLPGGRWAENPDKLPTKWKHTQFILLKIVKDQTGIFVALTGYLFK